MIAHSQLAPLPSGLPFDIVSKTIGQGAYACIKKARLPGQSQVFAVKFIHKDHALRHGRVTPKQLDMEITLHKHLGRHTNIVEFFQAGEDVSWRWIAMELAEGGDLFDKIESDVGVGEDVAHLYFRQLMSAVAFMHSKGVGHRDIKPENMLLSVQGDLKIADFGLATLFSHHGQRKTSKTSCGSPPYTAPEVVLCNASAKPVGYYGDQVDVWSCGVVLFVLLVGNTPWDEPTDNSYEFHEYLQCAGRPDDELWHKVSDSAVALLRGMMAVDPSARFSLDAVAKHPWTNRPNPYLAPDGRSANPVALATEMFETMHIDFSQNPAASQRRGAAAKASQDAMDIDSSQQQYSAADGAKTPTAEIAFDWDTSVPASQQSAPHLKAGPSQSASFEDRFADDPICSQFAPQAAVPLSRTQFARKFADILPEYSLTRFLSRLALQEVLPPLLDALKALGVPVADGAHAGAGGSQAGYSIKIRVKDSRSCPLSGEVLLQRFGGDGEPEGTQVCFLKTKGDPVQWRRLFKKVAVQMPDAIYKPES